MLKFTLVEGCPCRMCARIRGYRRRSPGRPFSPGCSCRRCETVRRLADEREAAERTHAGRCSHQGRASSALQGASAGAGIGSAVAGLAGAAAGAVLGGLLGYADCAPPATQAEPVAHARAPQPLSTASAPGQTTPSLSQEDGLRVAGLALLTIWAALSLAAACAAEGCIEAAWYRGNAIYQKRIEEHRARRERYSRLPGWQRFWQGEWVPANPESERAAARLAVPLIIFLVLQYAGVAVLALAGKATGCSAAQLHPLGQWWPALGEGKRDAAVAAAVLSPPLIGLAGAAFAFWDPITVAVEKVGYFILLLVWLAILAAVAVGALAAKTGK